MEYKSLGDRMKNAYENPYRIQLGDKMPVIIRLDGSHFRTLTKGFKKPFDDVLIKTMEQTTLRLCTSVTNCKFGYTESDEISLVMINDETKFTQSWFDNNLNKIVSVSASLATLFFNRYFKENVSKLDWSNYDEEYKETMLRAVEYGATFDSRCFILPKFEVNNYFYWRQIDASRNSVQMLAQSLYSTSEIKGIKNFELIDKMKEEKGIDWNLLKHIYKYGVAVKSKDVEINGTTRIRFYVDEHAPDFSRNKNYIEDAIYCGFADVRSSDRYKSEETPENGPESAFPAAEVSTSVNPVNTSTKPVEPVEKVIEDTVESVIKSNKIEDNVDESPLAKAFNYKDIKEEPKVSLGSNVIDNLAAYFNKPFKKSSNNFDDSTEDIHLKAIQESEE